MRGHMAGSLHVKFSFRAFGLKLEGLGLHSTKTSREQKGAEEKLFHRPLTGPHRFLPRAPHTGEPIPGGTMPRGFLAARRPVGIEVARTWA